MATDPLGALARDFGDVAEALEDTDKPDQESADLLGSAIRAGAPRATGYLAGSVSTYGGEVLVAAPYAGYVLAANPWAYDAIDSTDWPAPYVNHTEDALSELRHYYT